MIARKQKPGQFVILRIDDYGERIPITIAGSNPLRGSVTIIVQGIGKTTKQLNTLEAGDQIMDVVGPLGKPSEISKFGNAVVIGGGVGSAIAYPIAKALRTAGNHLTTILGARTKENVLLEEEMSDVSDSYWVTTDDGSYGERGLVSDRLQTLIDSKMQIDYVFAVGPVPMMRAVADVTRPYGIRTVVSLNPIMVDGTGMCGGCRVSVGGRVSFACVDGPEYDAHMVDFDLLRTRTTMYRDQERLALQRFEDEQSANEAERLHECRLTSLSGPLAGDPRREPAPEGGSFSAGGLGRTGQNGG